MSKKPKRPQSRNVGEGWTDVPVGWVAAPDTYVDAHGVLRSCGDDSCVVWHEIVAGVHCDRRGVQPDEIIYHPETGAPWCPECWQRKRFRSFIEDVTKE
jgi:hypothetical protein